jgi:serine/threonine-protein kinase
LRLSATIGSKLGLYEITALVGKGGMGEVYRARDTKLKREVAIKILPEEFLRDADRVSRFQREAEVLASLNHPNIEAIYDVQEAEGSRFLVLELIEGETLADRIERGPIPVAEALNIATRICEALEAAHEKGVVHRDLKPANVKITPDGKVKVLDFGLAKAMENSPASTVLSNSPTLVNSMAATNAGVIIGTAAYMSPEQARGKKADARSDVFSLGCVLYEMLTARRAFQGQEAADILVSVLAREPDFAALPPNVSPQIRKLLSRCLAKNPGERWHAAADLRIQIQDALANPAVEQAQTAATPVVIRETRREWALGVTAVAAIMGFALALWALWRTASPAAPLRISGDLGVDAELVSNSNANSGLTLSPDGTMLVLVAAKNGASQIYIRHLSQLQASPLAGTSGASSPFFSPDGQWLGFFADGKLKKISLTGGAPVTLADAPTPRGGSWGEDGYIVFHPNPLGGLLRVSSAGGTAEPLAKLGQGEQTHRWPEVLPGAKAVLYASSPDGTNSETSNIMIQPLPSGTPKVVIRGGYHPQYAASGHLLYIHEATLFAAPFDLNRLEVTGQSVPAVEGVSALFGSGAAQFAISSTGAFTYLPGQSARNDSPVLWMTHDGKTSPLRTMPSDWSNPQFSPDGQRLAMDIFSGNADVWIYEWARDTPTRLTFDPGNEENPVWTPDGKRIAFASDRAKGGFPNLYWQRADGTGEVQRLTESSNAQFPSSFHPSGKYLAFSEGLAGVANDLMILPIEGDETSGWKPGKPSVFLNTPADEVAPVFSPDGRWIVYASNESGRHEVFVRPFPGPGGKWQVSTAGGVEAAWSRTRRELLYRGFDNRIMVASYTIEGDSFKADKPRLWSEQAIRPRARIVRFFDLHPDGERIAAAVPSGQAEQKLDKVTFIFNFFDELRRIAPPSAKREPDRAKP